VAEDPVYFWWCPCGATAVRLAAAALEQFLPVFVCDLCRCKAGPVPESVEVLRYEVEREDG
jgi:hypothetical protein